MKVGDLVRLKTILYNDAPIGLIISIDHHPLVPSPIKVQWIDGNYDQYRSANELEVVSESR